MDAGVCLEEYLGRLNENGLAASFYHRNKTAKFWTMERKQIADGVYLTALPAGQFHRCRVSINFIWPADRQWATAGVDAAADGALLCRLSDMTLLSKAGAAVWRTSLSVDGVVNSGSRVLTVAMGGIKDGLPSMGKSSVKSMLRWHWETAFRPYFVDGVFDRGGGH